MTSLASSNSSKLTEQLYSTQTPETPEHHLPTIIRIGSACSSKHGRDSINRNSVTSDASTDSLGSSYIERANSPAIGETGQRRAAPIIPSIRRRAFFCWKVFHAMQRTNWFCRSQRSDLAKQSRAHTVAQSLI